MTQGLRKGLTSYGDAGFSLFLRKAFIKAMGYSDDALNRPIVGITNTYSDYNPCHGNVPQIIEAVKRGVMLAGAMPMVFPTISIAESFRIPDLDVSAQPDGDGYRGDDPRPADGCGCRDRRLRQDVAGADHGRGQRRPADGRDPGRTDGGRPSQGRGAGRLHRLPPAVGQIPRRRNRRRRDRSRQRPARAVGRHLHGDGHRQHHGLHHRSAGPVAADERDDPRAACRAVSLRGGQRQGRRRDGDGEGADARASC